MSIEEWDKYFLGKARYVASKSKDPSTKVGCIIVDKNFSSIGDGYNGFPRGIKDLPELYENREEKYKRVLHAEQNAILFSARSFLQPHILYTYPLFPCNRCALEIIQFGVKRVVSLESCMTSARWSDSNALAMDLFREAEVEVVLYKEEEINEKPAE